MFIDNQEEDETTTIFFLWEVESIKENNEDAYNKMKVNLLTIREKSLIIMLKTIPLHFD